MLLAPNRQMPGMLLNILWCTEPASHNKDLSVQNVNSVEAENLQLAHKPLAVSQWKRARGKLFIWVQSPLQSGSTLYIKRLSLYSPSGLHIPQVWQLITYSTSQLIPIVTKCKYQSFHNFIVTYHVQGHCLACMLAQVTGQGMLFIFKSFSWFYFSHWNSDPSRFYFGSGVNYRFNFTFFLDFYLIVSTPFIQRSLPHGF